MASRTLVRPHESNDASGTSQPGGLTCRRRWKRVKVFEPVLMHRGGLDERIHLLNLSSGGANIHAIVTLTPGQSVRLRLAGSWIAGRVTWTRNSYCGIIFGQPLGRELLALLSSQRASPGRPDF